MGDRDEEEELKMALRMSLHGSPPMQESPEAEARRKQRELIASLSAGGLRIPCNAPR